MNAAVPDRPFSVRVVDVAHRIERALAPLIRSCRGGRARGRSQRLHSIGVSVSDTKPETSTAAMMVTANSCSSRPRMPPMNSTGMNTAASDSVIDTMVKPISCEPSSVACIARLAHLHVAHDVLQHHDRVVDDEADAQRQRHQRQIVQAVARTGTSPRTCRRWTSAAPGWESAWRKDCAGTGRSPSPPARARAAA